MRVFVTGASGHIGSAVIPELLQAGHEVVGLARSDASAAAVTNLGANVHRGDLDDLDGLREAAAAADGVIHLAFNHDAIRDGDFEGAAAADLAAIQALAEPLVGTGKALVGTSGTAMLARLGLDRPGTENDVIDGGYRIDAENAVIALGDRGVRSSVLRLPPVVHSALDKHGFVPTLIAGARAAGRSGYVGDGGNRWPGGPHSRCRPPLPAGGGERARRITPPRRGRRGYSGAADRRSHRPSPGHPHRERSE